MRDARKSKKQLLEEFSSYRKQAELALDDNIARYKSLFEYNPDAIYSFDLNGRFTSANDTTSRFSGYSVQQLLKRTFDTLIVPEDLEKTRQHFLKAREGEPQNYETRIIRKDGEIILLNVTNVPIIINKTVTGICGIAQDITARKQAEEILRKSEEKYRSLASTTDSIYLLDKDCRYLFMNERHLKRFGLPLDQLIGRNYGEFHSEESTRALSRIVEKVLRTNKSLQHDYQSERDGRYFLRTLSPIGDREGTSTIAVTVVSKDITDRKKAEEKLKESEVRYRTLFDNANDAIFILRDDKFIDCNAVTLKMFGCTREQIVGSYPYVFSPPFQPDGRDSTEKALGKINKAIAGEPQFFEWKHCQYDRTPFDAEVSLNSVKVGNEVLIQALVRDITDRKRAEEAIRESEEKYRTLIESTLDLVFTVDRQGMLTYINPRLEIVTGHMASELIGRSFINIIAPEARNMAATQFKKGIRGDKGSPYEIEIIHKSGNRIPVEFNVTTLCDGNGQPIGRYGIGRDLTERKRTELALKESEDRLHSIVQGSPISTFVIGKDHRVVYWNRALEELSQIKAVDVIGTRDHWRAFYSKERPCMVDLLVDETFDKIPEWYAGKYRKSDLLEKAYEASDFFPDLGTGGRWLRFTAAVIRDTTGKLIGALETLEDITDRNQAEKELRESRRRFSEIIEFLPDATLVIDRDGKVIAWNRAIETMTGVKAEEMLGKGNYEYSFPFYGERRPILIDLALHPDYEMEKQYTSIQRMGDILFGEAFTPKLPPGNVHLSATSSVLRNSKGEVIAAIECIRDNTERKKLEERLHRAEKMEALGTLAGGVAHDLNNVLGGLVGYSELLLMDIPEGNPWRKHVTNVLQSSLRAAAIIQDLLTLARRGVEVSEVVNLNNVIHDYFKTPEFEKLKSYHPYVTYKTDIGENLLNIKGSPVHLEKTIMNLMSNASEAISGRGEVTIRTENHYLDKPIRGYDYMREGDYVVLTVSDNGRGISATDIKKIFEPFYTKKAMGRSGTGLGLAVVWGTVKDHDGYIDVQSEDGKGSTFKIYLPVTREELARDQQKISPEHYMGKGESILVVDDVKEQREVATSMLSRLGYKVHAVSSGEEAVAYLRTHEMDLLVLDMIMDPGIDGLETYHRVLNINPKQKAVIVSGFSETDRVKKAQELGAGVYVKKPYILEKLGLAIRGELLKISTRNLQD